MSESGKAVFLSYASQDAEAAKRICDALRAAGVEVWFDQSELVGGDAWDQKIRKQIRDCALLIPVISASTQARHEGYFRLEWRLADQRTHLMGRSKAFLLPVSIDGTRDAEADVPDSFVAVQWTKASGGAVPPAFVARVKQLLEGKFENAGNVGGALRPDSSSESGHKAPPTSNRRGPSKLWWALPIFGVTMVLILLVTERRHEPEPATVLTAPGAPVTPAERTIARVRAMLGAIDVTRSELDLASDLLEQAVKADPADARLFATWALLDCRYLTESFDSSPSRLDAARRHVAQAVSLDGADPEVRFARAVTMKQINHDEATRVEAMALLESVRTQLPGDPRVLAELGWATEWTDQGLAKAEDWWAQQAKLPGQAATAAFSRALRRAYVGDLRTSYPALVEADALGKSTKVKLWKAYLEVTWLGDLAAAKRTMAEVPVEAFVEDMAASARYTVAFWSRDYEEALVASRAVPREFMQSNAGVISTGYLRGVALARLGRLAAAENEWRAALGATERRLVTEPSDHSLLLAKGLLLVALGDKPAAAQVRRTAIELHGESEGEWSEDELAAELLPPEEAIARLQDQARRGAGLVTAAVLRHNPYYDRFRENPRFVALQAEADANPRRSPAAKASPAGEGRIIERKSQPAPAPSPQLVADAKSVAVLAFANLSDDKANEYFSDGISEELLNVLAKVPGLKVTARTSSFHFKGKDTPISEIAQQLGVAYVVEGSVRKSGDKVRITAQLIKAADGFHVWSDTFTRDLKDIFAVQDEIAGLIAQNLSLKLGMASSTASRLVDPEAYRLMLLGRDLVHQSTPESLEQAQRYLQDAIARDEKFAPAWAWLSIARWAQAANGWIPTDSGFKASREAAEKARALQPDLPEANTAVGLIYYGYDWDWVRTRAAFERAMSLAPGDAEVVGNLTRLAVTLGENDEAVRLGRQAVALDPLSGYAQYVFSVALLQAGRYAELEQRVTEFRNVTRTPVKQLVFALILLGKNEEALRAAGEFEQDNNRTFLLALAHGACGHRAEADAGLARLKTEYASTAAYQIAELHAYRGETDEAFVWLETSYRQRDTGMIYLKNDPFLKNLHTDPRWLGLLQKMNLPVAPSK